MGGRLTRWRVGIALGDCPVAVVTVTMPAAYPDEAATEVRRRLQADPRRWPLWEVVNVVRLYDGGES